ncbi:FliM/FliN family flagellar motor switch protein [Legionella nagasakiensis]|uniref:FliM/FliN family flagellar motor switch protein n=1 Tax=Legionella nagasakiensis TaxID=535290 RepID=UPI001054EFE6|nr:FliM/FliN family flagellar motor switch protein [Legionella nagasakiensis]
MPSKKNPDKPIEENPNKQAAENVSEPIDTPIFSNENIDILHDITLEVTVEIGSTKIKLSDLLNLKKGSVIELNQEADEPLTIYANDKPIAKGLVMEANGKYCIRVI